jgi:hypothetical protein
LLSRPAAVLPSLSRPSFNSAHRPASSSTPQSCHPRLPRPALLYTDWSPVVAQPSTEAHLPAGRLKQRRRRNQEKSKSKTETNRSVNKKEKKTKINCLLCFWLFCRSLPA